MYWQHSQIMEAKNYKVGVQSQSAPNGTLEERASEGTETVSREKLKHHLVSLHYLIYLYDA